VHFSCRLVKTVEKNVSLFLRHSCIEPELPQSHGKTSSDLFPGYREGDQPQTHEELELADLFERGVEHDGPGCTTRNSWHIHRLNGSGGLSKREKLQENHHHANFPHNCECRQNEKTWQIGHGFC